MELFKLFGTIAMRNSEANKGIDDTTDKAKRAKDDIEELGDEGTRTEGKLGSAFSKIGSAAAKVGQTIGVGMLAASAAVIKIGKDAIGAYSDYEQLVGGVETLFGAGGMSLQEYADSVGKTVDEVGEKYEALISAQDTVLEHSKNAYRTAGMSANEYMETVTSFSASLIQSLEGDTVKAAEVADLAITDMSDNANKMGTGIESIQNAYQGFAKQNYTMLDNLKLGYGGTKEEMQRLIDDANTLNEQQGKHTEYQLSNYADIVAAIHDVQTNMGITGTTAREASTTIQGSLSSAKAAWENLLTGMTDDTQDFDQLIDNFFDSIATVGENLIPRISTVLDGVANLIERLAPRIIEKIPDIVDTLLPPLINGAVALLRAVVDVIPQIVEMLVDVLPDIIDGVEQIFKGIVDALPELMKTICDALPTLIPQVITAIIDMIVYLAEHFSEIIQPLIDNLPDIIVSIVDALVDNLPKLIEGAIQLVLGLVQNLPKIIKGIIEALPEIIEKVIEGLIECLPQLIEGIIELVLELTIALPDIIVGILESIPDIMESIGEAFVKATPKLIAAFGRIFNKLKEKLAEKFPELAEWFSGLWENISGFFSSIGERFQGLWENITSVFSGIGEWFSGIWNQITEGWHTVFDPWIEIFKRAADWVNTNVVQPVTEFFKGLWENVSGFFSNLWDDISGVWSTVSDWFNTNVIEPVSGFFGGIWEKVSDGASQAWEGVKNAFSPVIDWFKNTFHEAWTKVKDVFSKGGEIFTGIKEGLFNGFKVVVNGLIDGINYIISQTFWGLNNALENIHNVEILGVRPFEWINTIDVPEIPKLAKGGVVDKPTITETGEDGPEAIVPLEKNTEWTENVAKQIHEFTLVNSAKDVSREIKPMNDMISVIREEVGQRISNLESSVDSALELMRQFFPELLSALDIRMVLDDGTLVAKITPKVDKQLGIIKRRKERS